MLNIPVGSGRLTLSPNGPRSRVVPIGRVHTIFFVTRSIAVSVPQGGALPGTPRKLSHGWIRTAHGVPYCGFNHGSAGGGALPTSPPAQGLVCPLSIAPSPPTSEREGPRG